MTIKELHSVCKTLQEISSRNEKERIIDLHRNDPEFRLLIKFLFDNNVVTGLDIKKINKDLHIMYSENENGDYRFDTLLYYVRSHNTGTDEDIAFVRFYIGKLTREGINRNEELEQFLKEIITKSLRLGIDVKTVNKVLGSDFIPTFEVQLGTPIDKLTIPDGEYIYISQKLNGTRCVYYKGELWTRNGKKYTGCQHIIKEIETLLNEYGCLPTDYVLDGELVLKDCGLSDSEAFQKGTGIANSNNETKEELRYVLFDIIPTKDFENKCCSTKYKYRKGNLLSLGQIISNSEYFTSIDVVPFFYEGTDHNEIWNCLDKAEEQDMEGVIVNLDTPYEFKRSKNLIKVKKFYDIDLECVGINNGEKGKYKDTLGAIVCKYKDNFVKVGSGFTEEQRYYYYNNPDEIIGKIVSVKYKEATKSKDGTESLQFPVFLCVREDKNEADV